MNTSCPQPCVESCGRLGQRQAHLHAARPAPLPLLPLQKRRLGWVSPVLATKDQSTTIRDTLNPNSPIAFLKEGPCLLCAVLLVPLQLVHVVPCLLAPSVLAEGEE